MTSKEVPVHFEMFLVFFANDFASLCLVLQTSKHFDPKK